MYGTDDLDLAGFALGIVERDAIVDGSARRRRRRRDRARLERPALERLHARAAAARARRRRAGDAPGDLLAPTRIYAARPPRLRAACDVRAMAHITGGGLPGNLPRVLPEGLARARRRAALAAPAVFGWLAGLGVERDEMRRVFNGGLGYVAIVPAAETAAALAACAGAGCEAWQVGEVVPGKGVEYRGASRRAARRARLGLGLEPGGADRARARPLGDDRRRVLEQRGGVRAERARAAGIESAVFALGAHGGERDRRDRAMAAWLAERDVGLVVCAGFMGVLGAEFLARFPRPRAQPASLAAARVSGRARDRGRLRGRVAETGVTVHLVDEVLDGGPVVAQARLPVNYDETPEGLRARIHAAEHRLLPAVVEDVARGALDLDVIARKART